MARANPSDDNHRAVFRRQLWPCIDRAVAESNEKQNKETFNAD
jgi:hypothetical protein